jgi:hypothetical protein
MPDESNPLEVEFRAEQVHTLGITTVLLDRLLRRLEQASGSADAEQAPFDREALLREARDRLWGLIVQREAMGIVHHEALYEVLEVPAEVRDLASHQVGLHREPPSAAARGERIAPVHHGRE